MLDDNRPTWDSASEDEAFDTRQNVARAEPMDAAAALREFEELDLTVVLGQFLRRPRATVAALRHVIAPEAARPAQPFKWENPPPAPRAPVTAPVPETEHIAARERLGQLGLFVVAFVLALRGATVMVANHPFRTENPQLIEGAGWFLIAAVVWLIGELLPHRAVIWQRVRASTWRGRALAVSWALVIWLALHGLSFWADASDEVLVLQRDTAYITSMIGQGALTLLLAGLAALIVWARGRQWFPRKPEAPADDAAAEWDLPWYMRIHPARPFLLLIGSGLCVVTWFNTANNFITDLGVVAWLGSVFMVTMAFAPRRWWNLPARIRDRALAVRRAEYKRYAWVILALGVIVAVGSFYRLYNLNGSPQNLTAIPPEMTSDHVEKILDAQRVREGSRNIFFANNGGREPFQMYAMAVFASLPGQGMTYESLKLLKVIESILILPFMFWLGYDLMRTERPRLRILMGLALTGLIAVSFWDVTITRLGLRIVLTPLVAALLLLYLARAMRSNDIGDYLKVGLVLGFGLYTYQAVRMLPVVVVLGAVMALLFIWWQRRARLRVIGNLAALVLVAMVAFLPMIHYTTQYPEQFLRRTFGRLLGDDVIEERLPNGMLVLRDATVEERFNAFVGNLPVLFGNVRNALLMFHWKGDVAWINNYPNYPALDAWSGALLLVGSVGWVALAWRRRDVVYAMIPLALGVMLLPSALSIAYPIENPSFTRTSGALPMVYLIAALPLALVADGLARLRESAVMRMLGAVVFIVPLAASYTLNFDVYMNRFPESYLSNALPHSEGGQILRDFVASGGSFGNAFLIAYPNWWDHRAVGLAAGMEDRWPNGVYDLNLDDDRPHAVDYVPDFIQTALNAVPKFRFDPNRPMLFFYHRDDRATSEQLLAWFPEGREILHISYQQGDDFKYFVAPPLTEGGLQAFLNPASSAEETRP
ncbi:MAG: hypothetical protein SNJ54_11090 [Anaerolineae bacterium]